MKNRTAQTNQPVIETLTDEELEQMLLEPTPETETTQIEHEFEVYENPDRLRYVTDDGTLFDVYQMPDNTVAVEPVVLKVEYNPSQIKKFEDWSELQEYVKSTYGSYSPYKAINAKLLRALVSRIAKIFKKINNPYV